MLIRKNKTSSGTYDYRRRDEIRPTSVGAIGEAFKGRH